MTMKTPVRSESQPISTRCAEIRERLEDFAAKRLGPVARGEVQGHLLDCEACNDLFEALLLEQVESGAVPLLSPPIVPPAALYERYLRARRPGTRWRAVLDKLLDAATREKAAARIEEIRAGFDLFVNPADARGAIRTRGAVTPPAPTLVPDRISADVLTPAGEPSGTMVTFEVRTPPEISADGHFTFVLSADVAEYDGRRVVCTIALSNTEPLSFEGTIGRRERQAKRAVVFEDEGLPGSGCSIPIDRVTLTIA